MNWESMYSMNVIDITMGTTHVSVAGIVVYGIFFIAVAWILFR